MAGLYPGAGEPGNHNQMAGGHAGTAGFLFQQQQPQFGNSGIDDGSEGGHTLQMGSMSSMANGGPVSAAEMAMLDASMGGMNGLDMDMSLPMDMDLDFSGTGDANAQAQAQAFAQGMAAAAAGQSQHDDMGGTSPLQQDQMMGSGSNGDMVTNSAPPPESNMTGVGAGPLPTGFGMPAQQNSSTLTEFTKRRNWSQRIIEELKDFLHILTPDGRILYVSPSCKSITGYDPSTIIGKFIGEYVHPDDSGIFMREFNESIASGNSLRFFYRFKKDDGTYMIFECDGHPHISPETPPSQPQGYNAGPGPGNGSINGQCRGFFMMARPYPTKNAALLDSFLEHKIENERLMKRIEELKREEREESAEQDRQLYREQVASQSGAAASESQGPSNAVQSQSQAQTRTEGGVASEHQSSATPNYQGMPPPAKPPISNTALTRQNLDSALSAQKPDSIADKMSRYEANSQHSHLESIELLTGLRYRDGERSHGISTGDTSPALIRGDAGIAILLDRDREGSGGKSRKDKKIKVADEYVCADCGTLDSPEWRKGPRGPKTLCNACGLRWAKKEKKRSGDETGSPHAGGGQNQGGMSQQQPLPGLGGGSLIGMPGGMSQQPQIGSGMQTSQPPGFVHQSSTGSSG